MSLEGTVFLAAERETSGSRLYSKTGARVLGPSGRGLAIPGPLEPGQKAMSWSQLSSPPGRTGIQGAGSAVWSGSRPARPARAAGNAGLRQGRNSLPSSDLTPVGLSPQGLPWPRGLEKRSRPRLGGLLQVFIFHLELGVAYRSCCHQRPCVRRRPTIFLLFLPATRGEKHAAIPRPLHPRGRIQKASPRSSHCHSPARTPMQPTCPGPRATSPTSLKDFFTSTKECQCAMGFRGYASISFQWSLPRPSASIPTRQTPMISLWPTLWQRQRARRRGRLPKGRAWGRGLCPAGPTETAELGG